MVYCNLHCIYGGCAEGKAEGREEGGLDAGSVPPPARVLELWGQRVEKTLQMLSGGKVNPSDLHACIR